MLSTCDSVEASSAAPSHLNLHVTIMSLSVLGEVKVSTLPLREDVWVAPLHSTVAEVGLVSLRGEGVVKDYYIEG